MNVNILLVFQLNEFWATTDTIYLSNMISSEDQKDLQWTRFILKPKGLSETLPDIRTLTYQLCGTEENNKSNNHI